MDCGRVEKMLGPYFDGELSPQESAQVEAALRDCPQCQEQLAFFTTIREEFRGPVLAEMESVDLSGMWEKVRAGIEAGEAPQAAVQPSAPVPEVIASPHKSLWEHFVEFFTLRPVVPLLAGAAAVALVVAVQLDEGEQQSPPGSTLPGASAVAKNEAKPAQETPPIAVEESGSEPSQVVVNSQENNSAFVSSVECDEGTVYIDQDPSDPSQPVIVWYMEDEGGGSATSQGG